MVDLYLNHNLSFGDEDFYNYYDIDVDKTLLLKESRNEYFVRYNDINKKKIVPLQVKIENLHLWKLQMCTSNFALLPIESDDKEFFIKCTEKQDKISELMDMYNHDDFVEISDYGDEFIMLDKEKGTSAIRDENKNYLVFVFTSVISNLPQASLIQYRY